MYEDLTPETRERFRACKSTEELYALADECGYELSDEELKQISGGNWFCSDECLKDCLWWCDAYNCPAND